MFATFLAGLRDVWQVRAALRDLDGLSDLQLQDIGLYRAQLAALRAASRPRRDRRARPAAAIYGEADFAPCG